MNNQRLRIFDQDGTDGAHWCRNTNLRLIENSEHIMKKVREITEQDEPLGIIISRGDRGEQRPVFSAYIWGPAPEPVTDTATKVA